MKLKLWLADRGIKQSELAYKTGMELAELNRRLNGWKTWSAEQAERVARFLDISPEEILRNNINARKGNSK